MDAIDGDVDDVDADDDDVMIDCKETESASEKMMFISACKKICGRDPSRFEGVMLFFWRGYSHKRFVIVVNTPGAPLESRVGSGGTERTLEAREERGGWEGRRER